MRPSKIPQNYQGSKAVKQYPRLNYSQMNTRSPPAILNWLRLLKGHKIVSRLSALQGLAEYKEFW